jgi:aspartate/methionine/tyrosine aminotransferase
VPAKRVAGLPDVPSRALAGLGVELLPLRGAPVRPPCPEVMAAVARTAAAPRTPPPRGLLELRAAVAAALEPELGALVDPEREVVVTNGSMQAIAAAFLALLDPGDEVLLSAPSFFYHGLIELSGGVARYVAARAGEGYRPDWEALDAAVGPRTRVLVVTTPANPSGYVFTDADAEALVGLAARHDLAVLCDEAYDVLVYDGRRHLSPFREPELRRRGVLVRSFTKSYAMGPWRIGYAVATPSLSDAVARAAAWLTLEVNSVSQEAALAALGTPRDWLPELVARYQQNRDRVCEAVAALATIDCHVPQGAAFAWLDLRRLGITAERLVHEHGIPAVDGMHFSVPGFARVPFGGPPEAIEALCDRLAAAATARG